MSGTYGVMRLVCVCGCNLADVVPPGFWEGQPDQAEVLDRLTVKPRPNVRQVIFRPANTHTTGWLVAHPEQGIDWTFSWTCKCGRIPPVKLATIRAWWGDAARSTTRWPARRVINA